MENLSSKKQAIAKKLCENLGIEGYPSISGSLLLFDENKYISPFRERFLCNDETDDDRKKFNEAFKIVTGGVGNEITKIDSVISSSLLSLLFFYKLFRADNSTLKLTIGEVTYNKVFFEVRNKCVGFPSCIDIALLSEDGKTFLFLESKLTEYLEGKSIKEVYGGSYCKLYKDTIIKTLLSKRGITVSKNAEGKLELSSNEEVYIEGIKQSISHLIGLVKGPQEFDEKNYDQLYFNEYKKAFDNATKLIYGTILFDLNKLDLEEGIDGSYYNLYIDIIGENGLEIVKAIRKWTNISVEDKKIIVLPKPLSYQKIISDEKNKKYLESLSDSIKKFYGFDKLQE